MILHFKEMQMDLSKAIMESIEKREKQQNRNYIGCSAIGNPCQRAIWYGYHNAPGKNMSAITQATFDVGHLLEGMILDYIEEAGFKIIRPSKKNHSLFCFDKTNPKFQGHMDGVLIIDSESYV